MAGGHLTARAFSPPARRAAFKLAGFASNIPWQAAGRRVVSNGIRLLSSKGEGRADAGVNINRHLASMGLCSRRDADSLVKRGLVLVNGRPAQVGEIVSASSDKVTLLNQAQEEVSRKISVVLHKPRLWVSQNSDASPEDMKRLAVRLLTRANCASQADWSKFTELHPAASRGPVQLDKMGCAGRLDFDSSGLLIFTQDGTVARSIVGSSSSLAKEYIVEVRGQPGSSSSRLRSGEALGLLRDGLSLDGRRLLPAIVLVTSGSLAAAAEGSIATLNITLREGRKHQIRRMCSAVGLEVSRLHRVRVGALQLGSLAEGKWRLFRAEELVPVRGSTQDSGGDSRQGTHHRYRW